jgi:hypothetical protein
MLIDTIPIHAYPSPMEKHATHVFFLLSSRTRSGIHRQNTLSPEMESFSTENRQMSYRPTILLLLTNIDLQHNIAKYGYLCYCSIINCNIWWLYNNCCKTSKVVFQDFALRVFHLVFRLRLACRISYCYHLSLE